MDDYSLLIGTTDAYKRNTLHVKGRLMLMLWIWYSKHLLDEEEEMGDDGAKDGEEDGGEDDMRRRRGRKACRDTMYLNGECKKVMAQMSLVYVLVATILDDERLVGSYGEDKKTRLRIGWSMGVADCMPIHTTRTPTTPSTLTVGRAGSASQSGIIMHDLTIDGAEGSLNKLPSKMPLP